MQEETENIKSFGGHGFWGSMEENRFEMTLVWWMFKMSRYLPFLNSITPSQSADGDVL